LVEFALTLPVWLVLLLGVMDFGRGFYAAVIAQQAAREGARIGAGTSAGVTVQQIQDRVVYALGYTCSGCPDLLALTGTQPTIHIGGYNNATTVTKYGYADGSCATPCGATCPNAPACACTSACSGGQIQIEVLWD